MTDWKRRGLCVGQAPRFDADVDGETETDHLKRITAALEMCMACPVFDACATTARTEPVEGIWAGHYHQRLDSQRKKHDRRTAA